MGAEDLYQQIIAKEGYALLDPLSDPDDFDKPILGPFDLGSDGAPGDGVSTGNEASRIVQLEYAVLKVGAVHCLRGVGPGVRCAWGRLIPFSFFRRLPFSFPFFHGIVLLLLLLLRLFVLCVRPTLLVHCPSYFACFDIVPCVFFIFWSIISLYSFPPRRPPCCSFFP